MAIDALHVKNFKGIADEQSFAIRPITLFIGPNSSGKSSCIHALGAMAQTIKIGSPSTPVVLDDEYAQLHLGRFIEVIHSRKYADSISLGVTISNYPRIRFVSKALNPSHELPIQALFVFRSTMKTQEIYLESAHVSLGEWWMDVRRKGDWFVAKTSSNPTPVDAYFNGPFQIALAPSSANEDNLVAMQVSRAIASELRKVLYLGPFRQPPQRRYPNRGSTPVEVGALGEASVTMLANEFIRSTRSRPHHTEVSSWLNTMGLAKTIALSRLGNSDLFDVNVKLKDDVSLPMRIPD